MRTDNSPAESIPEVELSADELLGMATMAAVGCSQPYASSSDEPRLSLPNAEGVQLVQATSGKHSYRLQLIGVLSIALVGSIALGAHYTFSKEEPLAQVPAQEWTALPEAPAEYVEEQEDTPAPPTLYRNPFDESEVFELPPGLSEEQARDRVAELLMERARSRHAR